MTGSTKNSISEILNSYTTDEIIEIFKNIEVRIQNLIQASTDDFLNLNKRFKKFYSDVNLVSEKSSEIFVNITSENQNIYLSDLKSISKSLNDIYNSVEYQIQKCYAILKNVSKNLNFINLNIRNFKQNLKTLKFLITNLKIVSITNENKKNVEEINQLINEINIIYPCFDDNFDLSHKIFANSLQTIISLKEKLDAAHGFLKKFDDSISQTENKFNEALKVIPLLKENTDKCSIGISKIITNLQYQDIIKQKIDHINDTHNQLISKLEDFEQNENNKGYLNNKAKLYVQISDISGLQAAQLIHANKEYQKALETITNQFIGIGEIIDSISGICNEYFDIDEENQKTPFEESINSLSLYKDFTKELQLINNLFELQIESLILKSESIVKCYEKVQTFNSYLDNFTNNIEKHTEKLGAQRLSKKTIIQIETISKELSTISNNLTGIKSDNEQLMKFLQKEFHDTYLKQNHDQTLTSESQKAKELSYKLILTYKNAHNLLLETMSNNTEISNKIKTAIQEVKYYDLFESEVEGIITSLNELNKRLKIQDNDAFKKIRELDNVKRNYTMESEHQIHDKFTNELKDLSSELFDDSLFASNDNEGEDEDNLELF